MKKTGKILGICKEDGTMSGMISYREFDGKTTKVVKTVIITGMTKEEVASSWDKAYKVED